ncbi:hypothetical protein TNCV_3276011 [Trichonephila clavipes]|nr:hypothetical protein TNCV_3276011 [Trichonephila clavipes]
MLFGRDSSPCDLLFGRPPGYTFIRLRSTCRISRHVLKMYTIWLERINLRTEKMKTRMRHKSHRTSIQGRYPRSAVILSNDQAKLLTSSRPPTTPATMTINLG